MGEALDILLIEPHSDLGLLSGGSTIPLWPAALSAVTPAQHRLDFKHCSYEKLRSETIRGRDLVGISTRTETANNAYAIADRCREMGVPVVMGGVHASMCPGEAEEHCDALVVGEAENTWPTVVGDVQENRLASRYRGTPTAPEEFPMPDFPLVRKYKYQVENVLETVRGCPNVCEFCSATQFSGKKYRFKPTDQILREIGEWRRNAWLSVFADLNIGIRKSKAKEVFEALVPYKLNWMAYATVDIVNDDELLELMSRSGCIYLGLGFESVSDETLQEMNKSKNARLDYKEIIRTLHYYNIDVFGNFIFGLDTDSEDVFEDTVDYALEAGIDFPVYQNLTPYPGTQIHDRLEESGRLLTNDWSRYNRFDAVYEPKQLSPVELMKGLFWAYEETYSRKNRLKRFFQRSRGLKRSLFNEIILRHVSKQFYLMKKHYGYLYG